MDNAIYLLHDFPGYIELFLTYLKLFHKQWTPCSLFKNEKILGFLLLEPVPGSLIDVYKVVSDLEYDEWWKEYDIWKLVCFFQLNHLVYLISH